MNGMYQQQQSGGNDSHHQENGGQPQHENPQSKTLWIGDVEPWMNEQHIAA